MLLYLCPMIQRTFKKESAISAVTLHKYKLKLSLTGDKYTSREPDKLKSGIQAVIQIQIFLGHNTPDNENPRQCQMNQPIYMESPQSGYISY